MANTTNFGWETPDDTDLVKDGAAAMRTLGNAIDASLVDLKGGTTGQVLSKNTNTDMDFTWVTTDDANAIQNAIVDAKGDLIAASAADTPARLAVGANGDTLVADSSTTTGLRYNPPVGSLANPVINGGMDIWQRGTTITGASGSYGPDRWLSARAVAGSTFSRQSVNDSTNVPNIQYSTRVQRDSGNTSTQTIAFYTAFESANSIPFAGKTVTVSFYYKTGANFSGTNTFYIKTGTGTDQSPSVAWTGQSLVSFVPTSSATWTRQVLTTTISSTATQIGLLFDWIPSGTAGANDWFEVTGVQMDVGTYTASTAPTFRRSGGTLAGELAACQRYYWRAGDGTGGAFGVLGTSGYTDSTTNSNVVFVCPVRMRTAPTVLDTSAFANTRILNLGNPFSATAASITANSTTPDAVWVQFTSSGMTASQFSQFTRNNSATAFIGFSAEL